MMRNKLATALYCLLIAWTSQAESIPLTITAVGVSRDLFEPEQGESVSIHYHLNVMGKAKVKIYDDRDLLIRTLNNPQFAQGDQAITWDGKDHQGRVVPREVYRYTIEAESNDGQQAVYDLSDLNYGRALRISTVHWDKVSGEIKYRLPSHARVNIRIGLKDGGPLLRTLVNWLPRRAGTQTERWDGLDASKVLNVSEHEKLELQVMAYGLSSNALFVGAKPAKTSLIDHQSWSQLVYRNHKRRPLKMRDYRQQGSLQRKDFLLSMEIQDFSDAPTKDGFPVISGISPILLNVDTNQQMWALNRRFEMVVYVDGLFNYENETGFLPSTYDWDTSRLTNGVHYLTANLLGYEGNMGMSTLKVWVENPK